MFFVESICDDPDVIATNILVTDKSIYAFKLNYECTFDLELLAVMANNLYKCLFHKGCEGVQPRLP